MMLNDNSILTFEGREIEWIEDEGQAYLVGRVICDILEIRRHRDALDKLDDDVYLHAFETGSELRVGLTKWITHYNGQRPHTALAGRTPDEAYHGVPTPSGPGLTPDQMANSNAVRMAA